MIYAIVTNDKKLAPRFSKADIFTFYNDRQEVIGVYKNPALAASGCAAKQSVIDLLYKMNCDIVIVRKIGEKTLARLLNAGFKVEQGNTRHNDKETIGKCTPAQTPADDSGTGGQEHEKQLRTPLRGERYGIYCYLCYFFAGGGGDGRRRYFRS